MSSSLMKLTVLSALVLAACTPSRKTTLESLGGEEVGIFSNRQINQDQFIAVVKLDSPALLTTAKKVDGKTQVDPELVNQINEEQTKAIEDLKALSSEIRVLYRYKMVLNGFAIIAPIALKEELRNRLHVSYVEKDGQFGRPVTFAPVSSAVREALATLDNTSVKFIGGDKAHQAGIRGQGMKVGIIDTGIDYTHSMMGGAGTAEAYQAVNPDLANAAYPNAKVVGGIDLVGTVYDSGSGDYSKHLPIPDENPLDQGGHGTHVGGTVAGIGDGVETYSGVAPDALLHAIKVFGADGSTGDAVVIAGLEYAADPNHDADPADQLDVVNMSLGSSYGSPHVLYEEAIGNLSRGGTVVVASAGNSGNFDYIVGAPSIVEEAISVAASVDDMPQNWKFDSVRFDAGADSYIAEAIQGVITKPIADVGDLAGDLVHVGLAAEDFSSEVSAAVRGHVALIDRGVVPFSEKIRRAVEAGAIAVVVANNQPSQPISMGGDGNFEIPGIMISQALGQTLKAKLTAGQSVTIHFKNDAKIEKPELIDTLTGFSSKGPRSIDGLLKPEISAPGSNVISAKMGQGSKGVQMSGTSMAGPHIAGVMALLKQAFPELSSADLKSVLMGHAKSIGDEHQNNYLLSRQGAGRVQIDASLTAKLVANKAALSLGEINIETQKVIRQPLTVRNISNAPVTVKVELTADAGLSLDSTHELTLAAGESKDLMLKLRLNVARAAASAVELDGLLKLTESGVEVHRIPVLAVLKRISQVSSTGLKVAAGSENSSAGAAVEVSLKNEGTQDGVALPFNLLGLDSRKKDARHDPFMSKICDLQAVGYRLIEKDVDGQKLKLLQIGVKTYDPMTSWNMCEVSVLIDSNGDQVAEQELAAIQLGNVKGLSTAANEQSFASVLFDAALMRTLRGEFELAAMTPAEPGHTKPEENYAAAVIDMQAINPLNRSTVMIVEADVTKLVRRAEGNLAIKVAAIFNDPNSVEMDDFLSNQATEWQAISIQDKSQSYMNLPESIEVKAGASVTAEFDKGQGQGKLLLLFPDNRTVVSDVEEDNQLQVLAPQFGF
jgi:minor extracellular serine protease Vpr